MPFRISQAAASKTLRTVALIEASKGTLVLLVGFGLLGAMNRRSSPQPLRNELGL